MLNSAVFMSGPVLVSLAAFGVHAALGYQLTAAVAFPALSLFNLLRFPIIMFPSQVQGGPGAVLLLSCRAVCSGAGWGHSSGGSSVGSGGWAVANALHGLRSAADLLPCMRAALCLLLLALLCFA